MQVFSKASNTIAPATLIGAIVMLAVFGGIVFAVYWSPYTTLVGIPINQPVPFSHEHHVGGLGIDCRYCHTGVETAAYAGVPPTRTCMTCHSQLWTEAKLLEPVRRSLVMNEPIRWKRVNDVPDFVYFNHSVHINKGVSCVTCHGRVDQMPIMKKGQTLYMRWCLDCHQEPERFLRDKKDVFNMASRDPDTKTGEARVAAYHIDKTMLQDCSTCHR